MSASSANPPRAIFVMGPTASGKTALAIELRKQLSVELINVDSAQIYVGLDIGSAKPDAATLAAAPHRLLDIRDPTQAYSAADFLVDAKAEMADIVAAGKVPLLVGGSMMYFKVLLEGLSDLPEANPQIRAEIEQQAALQGWPALYRELEKVDPQMAGRLHPNHSQRIQRALEVYRISGVPMSSLQGNSTGGLGDSYDIVQFSLLPQNRSLLHSRIETRFQQMMKSGLEQEVRALYQRGDLHADLPAIRSVGYRQLWDYCSGKCSLAEAQEKAVVASRQLAKRQLTWLRNWPQAIEIAVDSQSGFLTVDDICAQCLKYL